MSDDPRSRKYRSATDDGVMALTERKPTRASIAGYVVSGLTGLVVGASLTMLWMWPGTTYQYQSGLEKQVAELSRKAASLELQRDGLEREKNENDTRVKAERYECKNQISNLESDLQKAKDNLRLLPANRDLPQTDNPPTAPAKVGGKPTRKASPVDRNWME